MQNSFIWHDLMTSDVESAKKFYADVVGWRFDPQMPTYDVTMMDETGARGIMPTLPEFRS